MKLPVDFSNYATGAYATDVFPDWEQRQRVMQIVMGHRQSGRSLRVTQNAKSPESLRSALEARRPRA